jgi:uncharacterized membrane protein
MNSSMLFPTCLTLHLIALTLMAGTTLVDYITFKTFWKFYYSDKEKANGILQASAVFSRLIGIGAALLIITGIGMMALTNGVFGEQLWFRIKFGLVLLLILNGVFVGRRLGVKIRKLVLLDGPEISIQINALKSNLNRFHIIQLSIFCLIIFLSAFKFN